MGGEWVRMGEVGEKLRKLDKSINLVEGVKKGGSGEEDEGK